MMYLTISKKVDRAIGSVLVAFILCTRIEMCGNTAYVYNNHKYVCKEVR